MESSPTPPPRSWPETCDWHYPNNDRKACDRMPVARVLIAGGLVEVRTWWCQDHVAEYQARARRGSERHHITRIHWRKLAVRKPPVRKF